MSSAELEIGKCKDCILSFEKGEEKCSKCDFNFHVYDEVPDKQMQDDKGILCRYTSEKGWFPIEDHCIECGYKIEQCECNRCKECCELANICKCNDKE